MSENRGRDKVRRKSEYYDSAIVQLLRKRGWSIPEGKRKLENESSVDTKIAEHEDMVEAKKGNIVPSSSIPSMKTAGPDAEGLHPVPIEIIEKSFSISDQLSHQFGTSIKMIKELELGGKSAFSSISISGQNLSELSTTQSDFLFAKTLNKTDTTDFFAISTEHALAHFPSLQFNELGNFTNVKILAIHDMDFPRTKVWEAYFIYCFARKSYGIIGWEKLVTAYKLKTGDEIHFFKSNHPSDCNRYYIELGEGCRRIGTSENTRLQDEKMLLIKMYGYKLNYLFEKELTRADVTYGVLELRIHTPEAEKYFPPLKKLHRKNEGDELTVADPMKERREMRICLTHDWYMISSGWWEFVSTHNLGERDVIRFFKIVNDVRYVNWYLIDYVRYAKGVCTPGKKHLSGSCGS